MVTKRDPERARRLILDAAAEAFAAHGPEGARIDVIAATAGVNKRMLYHYFGNKEALFAAVLDDRLGVALADTLPDASPDSLPVAAIDLRLMVWASVAEVVPGTDYTAAWSRLVARVESEQASGQLRGDVDASLVAVTLFAVPAMSSLMPKFVGEPVTTSQLRKLLTSAEAPEKTLSGGNRRESRPRIRMQPDVRGR